MRANVASLCAMLFFVGMAQAQDADKLAKQAQGILKSRCYSCHGEGGSNEGGFNYVLNRKRLARELVVPGSPDESKLFERVRKGEMPDGGPPLPKDEQDTLKKWIDAGAPPFAAETKRVFIRPVEMLGLMLKDLEQANERDRPFKAKGRRATTSRMSRRDPLRGTGGSARSQRRTPSIRSRAF